MAPETRKKIDEAREALTAAQSALDDELQETRKKALSEGGAAVDTLMFLSMQSGQLDALVKMAGEL